MFCLELVFLRVNLAYSPITNVRLRAYKQRIDFLTNCSRDFCYVFDYKMISVLQFNDPNYFQKGHYIAFSKNNFLFWNLPDSSVITFFSAVVKGCQHSITYYQRLGSASHKSWAASARATTLKILRCKRFRKPKKIIAPQAQVWRFEMYNFNWLTAQTSLGYGTKPIFESNYARYQISKQKIVDFL